MRLLRGAIHVRSDCVSSGTSEWACWLWLSWRPSVFQHDVVDCHKHSLAVNRVTLMCVPKSATTIRRFTKQNSLEAYADEAEMAHSHCALLGL